MTHVHQPQWGYLLAALNDDEMRSWWLELNSECRCWEISNELNKFIEGSGGDNNQNCSSSGSRG